MVVLEAVVRVGRRGAIDDLPVARKARVGRPVIGQPVQAVPGDRLELPAEQRQSLVVVHVVARSATAAQGSSGTERDRAVEATSLAELVGRRFEPQRVEASRGIVQVPTPEHVDRPDLGILLLIAAVFAQYQTYAPFV